MGEGDQRQCGQCGSWAKSGRNAEGELAQCWYCDACWAKWDQPAPSGPPPVPRPAPDARPGSWRLLSEESPFRSEQLRLLFRLAGADFEDRRLSEAEAQACRGASAGDASPLPMDILPAVVHGSHIVSTVAGAMQYAAESLDLGGEPGAPRCRALMVVIGCEAMRNEAFFPAHDKICETRSRITAFPMEGYNKWFGHFERYLRTSAAGVEAPGASAGPYVLGQKLCYADLALYDCCTAVIDLGCYGRDEADRAQKFPRLCALLEAVAGHPRMAGYGRPHAEALRAIAGDLKPAPAPSARAGAAIWEVVGGSDSGGIVVRAEKSTASKAEAQRLATGSLVKELQMEGERLRYERLSGVGPDTGWVSVSVKGKELLTKTVKRPLNPPMKGHELPPPPEEGSWRVLYYESPGRGQQVRLMFHFANLAFEDKKLSDEEVQYYKSRFARDSSPLAFDFVPIVQHGSCTICTTAGSLQYIGEQFGYGSGDDAAARSKMVMLVVASELMRNQVVYAPYPIMRKKKKRIGYWDPGLYHQWFGHFERYLRTVAADAEAVGAETGPYLLGPKLCYADLVLYDCFTYIIDLGCYGRDEVARAEQYPRICALVEAVGRQPNLAKYGRPHEEDLAFRAGRLPPPRTPEDEPPPVPPPRSRRELLQQRLAELEEQLREASDDAGGDAAADRHNGIEVVIGSSQLMAEQPGLVEQLAHMINSAYEESVRDNPVRKGQHKSVTPEEIHGRMSIGDSGTRNNRVLHVAFQGKRAVGCISSSFSTPWTPPSVGHWGLLAVDAAAQGQGVASALVSSAMRRLAQRCDEAHIEYFFTASHKYSERLKAWYEGKLGFRTVSANPAGPGTTFRVGRRDFTADEQARGRRARLRELRDEVAAELGALNGTAADGLRCGEVFGKLAKYVRAKGTEVAPHIGAAFQFDIVDAGPEGKFFVDLRPGMVCAWYGEEPTADFSLQTSDADLDQWLTQQLQGDHAFWSGRAVVTDPEEHVGKLMWVYHEACTHHDNS